MINRIRHIGLATSNLEEVIGFFRDTFNMPVTDQESFGELAFAFIPLGETQLELLQSTTSEGQIAKFIAKKGQGVHHIALEVDDIQAYLDMLKSKGVQLINEKPYRNAHEELVAFLHPKSTYGILIELIQAESD